MYFSDAVSQRVFYVYIDFALHISSTYLYTYTNLSANVVYCKNDFK